MIGALCADRDAAHRSEDLLSPDRRECVTDPLCETYAFLCSYVFQNVYYVIRNQKFEIYRLRQQGNILINRN